MDFLDPKKRRAYTVRLFVGYILMAVALSIGALVLLYEAYGYDVNRRTGEIIQNGLVFVDSQPESSGVYINDKYETNTGARLVLPSGDYTIRLQREGYRSWQRSFELGGSDIERLNYPLLFPRQLEPVEAKRYSSAPSFTAQSPDRRWLIARQSNQPLGSFDVIDLNGQNNPVTTISLPEGMINQSAGNHTLSEVEWADNRRILVKHSFQGGSEFLVIDHQAPTESFSVNQAFPDVQIVNVSLFDGDYQRFHILDSQGRLGIASLPDGQFSSVVDGVLAYKAYEDNTLLYVTEETAPDGKVLAVVRSGSQAYEIREMPKAGRYLIDITRYDGRWFVAAGVPGEKRVFVYRNPFTGAQLGSPHLPGPVAAIRVDNPGHLSVSPGSRFVSLQGGSEFSVYDAEHDRTYRYDTGLDLAADYKARWPDGHHFMVVSKGNATVFDFDGINVQTLTPATPSLLPYFGRDYNFIYNFGPSEQSGQAALLQTPMRTPEDQ